MACAIEKLSLDALRGEWLPQALIDRTPAQLQALTGLSFDSSYDDLDYFVGLHGRLPDGTTFLLQQHRGGPQHMTAVRLAFDLCRLPYTDVDLSAITAAVAKVATALGLSNQDIIWQRKDDPSA